MEYIYLRFKKSEKYVLERMDKTGQLINAIGISFHVDKPRLPIHP